MSLLDKARRAAKRGHSAPARSVEEMDLLMAFLIGELTYAQVATALGISHAGVGTWVVGALRTSIVHGDIVVERVARLAVSK